MNLDVVTELTSLAVDLDAVMEVLLEGSAVEERVGSGLAVVERELALGSNLGRGGLGLGLGDHQPTEKGAQQSDDVHHLDEVDGGGGGRWKRKKICD